MWRGRTLLIIGWLVATIVGVTTVLLLRILTAVSGGTTFLIATFTTVVAFALYALIVTKMGY